MHSISLSSAAGGCGRFRVVRLDQPYQGQPRNHSVRLGQKSLVSGQFTARVPGQRRKCPLRTHYPTCTPTPADSFLCTLFGRLVHGFPKPQVRVAGAAAEH